MWYHGAKKVQKRAQKKQQQSVIYEWGVNLPDCTIVDFGFGRCYGVFSMCLKKSTWPTHRWLGVWFSQTCLKRKASPWSPAWNLVGGLVWYPLTEVRYIPLMMKYFFASPALTGTQENFEDLWGAADPLSASLCVSLLKMTPPHSIRNTLRTITLTGDRRGRGSDCARGEWHTNPAVSSLTNRMPETPPGREKRGRGRDWESHC